jgi:hypothetical protein
MGQSAGDNNDTTRAKQSVYLLLDMIVTQSPYLTDDLLESCFPYVLLRASYHHCYLIDAATQLHSMQTATSAAQPT